MLMLLILAPLLVAAAPKPTNSRPLLVAIVDTGIDMQNKELRAFMDKTEFHGWNFSRNNDNLQDLHGHGTHIAGLITKDQDPNKVQILVLKYFDPSAVGVDTVKASNAALRYAIDKKVDIINFSGGGGEANSDEFALLKEAQQKGILVVAAAGNEKQNMAVAPFFPAGYNLSNVISVAALDKEHHLVASSNYGSQVDTAALGYRVVSNLPHQQMGPLTGTSQATANVTHLLVQYILALGYKPEIDEIKKLVRLGGQSYSNLQGKTAYGNEINLAQLLQLKGAQDSLLGGPLVVEAALEANIESQPF